jgi:hypothetical protein
VSMHNDGGNLIRSIVPNAVVLYTSQRSRIEIIENEMILML